MEHSSKLLSFCFFGRNDNYTPDFLYRLSTTINFLAHSAKIAGRLDALEILIVDWASADKLKDHVQLTAEGAKIVRFIYVPPEHAKQYNSNGIPANICANIALRRAEGKLIATCGAEVLIPASSLAALFNIIENKSAISDYEDKLYVCGRYRLPIEWVKSQPSVDEWQDYLQLNSWRIKQEPGRGSFLTGNAGLFIIPKNILHQSRGLLEALDPYWGWNDVEYTMRAISQYQCIDLNSSGVTVYDMEHFKLAGERSKIIKKPAKRLLGQHFATNDDNWGGGDLPVLVEQAISSNNGYSTIPEHMITNVPELSNAEILSQENKLNSFCIWMAENLVVLPGKSELKFIAALFNVLKSSNLLYYKEYGINQGHSFYLMGFLFKHSTLIGIDHWAMGGGEYGPDHIAYNLTTPIMSHQGHLRLINKNLLIDSPLDLSDIENTTNNGLIVYRLNQEESIESIINTLNYDITTHDIVLVGDNSHSIGKLIKEIRPTFQLEYKLGNEYCFLYQDRIEIDLCVPDELIQKMLLLSKKGINLTEVTIEMLSTKLKELEGRSIVIWGTGRLTELIWPHVSDNVIGFISTELSSDKNYKGKALIEFGDDILSSDIIIVKTF